MNRTVTTEIRFDPGGPTGHPGPRAAGLGAASLLGATAAMQVALASGAPWGEVVYGGRAETVDGVLSGPYRASSAAAAGVLLFAARAVAEASGATRRRLLPAGFASRTTWVVAAGMGLNTLANLAGRHPFERRVLAATTAATAGLSVVVAVGARRDAAGCGTIS